MGRGEKTGPNISLYTVFLGFFLVPYVCENTAIFVTFSAIQFICDTNDVLFWDKPCSHKINIRTEYNINMLIFHRTFVENYLKKCNKL